MTLKKKYFNSTHPTVSVIIPTHNRAHLVGRAINSVLSQTYSDFELIVVDDASNDGTDEVIRNYDDTRIRYIRHQDNKGAPATRNTGIKQALGDYIGLLDDDDEWLPAKLEKQIKVFQIAPERVGLVYTGVEAVESTGNILWKSYPKHRGDLRIQTLRETTMHSQTPLIKKECFVRVGYFDETLKSCQDWDMWKRIAENFEFDYIPEVLARTHFHDNRISTDYSALIPGRTRMVEKHLDEFRKHPGILVIHLKRLGKLHCLNGTWGHALQWYKEALKLNFLEIIKIIAWCIIEFPRIKLFEKAGNFKKYKI